MKIHKGCTYWYEVSMIVDIEGNGHRTPAKVRLPVRCEASGTYASTCTYLDPSSCAVVKMDISNNLLFDSPMSSEIKVPLLPSKDEAVGKGFNIANANLYHRRRVLSNDEKDLYFTGWMECFEWISIKHNALKPIIKIEDQNIDMTIFCECISRTGTSGPQYGPWTCNSCGKLIATNLHR